MILQDIPEHHSIFSNLMEPHLPMGRFHPAKFLSNRRNVVVLNGQDLVLLEHVQDVLYSGHMFFVSRGRQAIKSVQECLDVVWDETPVQTIRGLTPITKPGALWLAKHIGFTVIDDLILDGINYTMTILNRPTKGKSNG